MDICTLALPYALLLSALLLGGVSGTQQCAPQVIPDMVIDISQAVARGARFTDPLSVISKEECLSACCKQLDVEGVQECNLMVFDARKSRGEPNCYIFHCPTIDSCPLTPSRGVFSYSLWSETPHPVKRDPEKVQQKTKSSDHSKVQSSLGRTSGSATHPPSGSTESGPLDLNNKKNSTLIASQEPAKHVKEEPANSSQKITTQLLHLASTIDQHLEKMESKSAASKDNLQIHYPSAIAATVPTIRTTTIPIHVEVKKTLPDAKEAKPGIVTYKMPDNFTFIPTVAAKQVDTVPKKTSLSTAAPKPVHRTKANLIVTSSRAGVITRHPRASAGAQCSWGGPLICYEHFHQYRWELSLLSFHIRSTPLVGPLSCRDSGHAPSTQDTLPEERDRSLPRAGAEKCEDSL